MTMLARFRADAWTPIRHWIRRLTLIGLCAIGTMAAAVPAGAASSTPDPAVAAAQRQLTEAGFYRGEIDGSAGPMTRASVLAFEKVAGLERDGQWRAIDQRYLQMLTLSLPERPDEPDRVEIDLTNQVGYLVKGGAVEGVFGVSSGNGEIYDHPNGYRGVANTPRGDFVFYRHVDGVRRAPLGELYRPWYFRGGFAVHGSGSVPAYPASHGCVRVTNWDADWLADQLELGMPVHIWDGALAQKAELVYERPSWSTTDVHPI